MCYNKDKLGPLAVAIKPYLPIYSAPKANKMIQQHTQLARGQRSEVVGLAEKLFANRHRHCLTEALNRVQGTDNQHSALREAIMMVLREQASKHSGKQVVHA